MFEKYFKLRYEQFYAHSYLITFIGLLLPWIRSFILYIPGIILPFGNALFMLLLISAALFYLSKRKKKHPSTSTIIMGVLCLITTIGHLIAHTFLITESEGFVGFGMGVYVALLGSLGIITSGVLGSKHKKNI